MQIPTRRSDKIPRAKSDPFITRDKYDELLARRDRLINFSRPKAAIDVKHMASMGDFSENAGYQMAKAKLRGINNRVNEIEDLLRRAQIIENRGASDEVRVGSSLELEVNGKVKTYQILGSAESDPARGIISHVSPLGMALLGHHENEVVLLELPERTVKYKIIKIF